MMRFGVFSVEKNLHLGPHPLRPEREFLKSLLSLGITCLINLTEPNELPQYPTTNLRYHNIPIRDFSVPTPETMTNILDILDNALANGHTVYLHCHGGRGRTGTVIGCWLVRHGMTGEEALARIAELRGDDNSPETGDQRTFVLNWNEAT